MGRGRPTLLILALGLVACAAPTASPPTPAALITPPAESAAAVRPTATRVPLPATATSEPTTTVTPAPTLIQLTTGGCCTQPFWSPDGAQVWYIDRPPDTGVTGVWAVDPTAPLAPSLVTERIGAFSPDGALIAYPVGDRTVIERIADGEAWDVSAAGRAVQFSPDGQWIAWQVANGTENFDRRLVEIWISRLDGSEAARVTQLFGGGLSGWMPDSRRLLITQRNTPGLPTTLGVFDPVSNTFQGLATGDFLRGISVSPDGRWLVYTRQFSGNTEQDGIWIQPIEGGEPLRLTLYGAYRWRPDGRLLLLPLDPGAPAQRVVLVDAATGQTEEAINPNETPLRILGGDWALSPDGRRIVFVSAVDRNLWLASLP